MLNISQLLCIYALTLDHVHTDVVTFECILIQHSFVFLSKLLPYNLKKDENTTLFVELMGKARPFENPDCQQSFQSFSFLLFFFTAYLQY